MVTSAIYGEMGGMGKVDGIYGTDVMCVTYREVGEMVR